MVLSELLVLVLSGPAEIFQDVDLILKSFSIVIIQLFDCKSALAKFLVPKIVIFLVNVYYEHPSKVSRDRRASKSC
jgi:hypothetical protein